MLASGVYDESLGRYTIVMLVVEEVVVIQRSGSGGSGGGTFENCWIV